MTRVLVTGGSGFIGSFIVEALQKHGTTVRVPKHAGEGFLAGNKKVEWMEGDLSNVASCMALVRDVDEVMHLASFRRNVAYHREHADEVVTKNIAMTDALVAAVSMHPVPVTAVSTAKLFGIPDPASAPDGYIRSKFLSEERWKAASASRGFPLMLARPVSVYGPRDRFGDDANVIPSLLQRALAAKDELVVWGSGLQRLSFVYVENLAYALLELRRVGATGVQPVDPGDAVTVAALAEHITTLVNPALRLRFDASKPTSDLHESPAGHPCLRGLAWTSLEEGLRLTLDWYRTQKPLG